MQTRNEFEIISDIESLSQEQGFIYTFAFMVYGALCYSPEEIPDIDWTKRPNSQEMAFLLGVMVRHPIDLRYPSSEKKLYDQMTTATQLLEEPHKVHDFSQFLNSQGTSQNHLDTEQISEVFASWRESGQSMVEPIFYGDLGAFDFQLLDMAKRRYKIDCEWIDRQIGIDWDSVVSIAERLQQTLETQINKIGASQGFEQVLDEYLSAFSFGLEDVQDLSQQTLDAFVGAFSLVPGTANQDLDSIGNYNRISSHPIVQLANGQYFLPLPFFLAKSIYESPFYWMNDDKNHKDIADKNRGDFSEEIT